MSDVASPAPPRSEDMARVGVIYALFLVGWISGGVTTLVGLVMPTPAAPTPVQRPRAI